MIPSRRLDDGSRESTLVAAVADHLLRRPRLDARLSEWAPITVVRGLQGYGKTTAVAAWLDSQTPDEVTVTWVTARPANGEIQRFEECLSQSLRNAGLVTDRSQGESSIRGFDQLGAALLKESRGSEVRPRDRRFSPRP